jgi:hypothetical protein
VSGGAQNHATSTSASVSGGHNNTASYATSGVSGGADNQATAQDSSISGGYGIVLDILGGWAAGNPNGIWFHQP